LLFQVTAGFPKLGPGNDLVWSGRQDELDAGVVVGLDGGRKVERGELNVLCPMSALPVISAGVKSGAYDRVFGHLFAMAVAEDQDGRWLSWALSDQRRCVCFSVVSRRTRPAFRGLLSSPEAHISVALQFNQQRFGSRFWRRVDRALRLYDDNLRRGLDRPRLSGIIRIEKRAAKENRAGADGVERRPSRKRDADALPEARGREGTRHTHSGSAHLCH
jgi:hypothetical protein